MTNEALFDAVVTNDECGVIQTLDAGADPSFADARYGWKMLYWAADKGHALIAEFLLDEGADPNTRGFECETPLHAAARWGNMGMACVLLGYGADVNARDERGRTPLHRAVQYGRSKAALLFLLCGSYTSSLDDWGRRPCEPPRSSKYQNRVSRAINTVKDWEQGGHDLSILEPELANLFSSPPGDQKEMWRLLVNAGCDIAPEIPTRPFRASLKYHEYAEHRRRDALEKELPVLSN